MVVTVAAAGPGTDAEPVTSTFFASRYVRDPLPRSVTPLPLMSLLLPLPAVLLLARELG
jgi:hypothetical protein